MTHMDYTTTPADNQEVDRNSTTLAAIAKMECPTMTPAIVARVLGSNPHSIRLMAATEEGRQALGFPVIRTGNDTRIPRAPFLRYMGWEGEINGATEEACAI